MTYQDLSAMLACLCFVGLTHGIALPSEVGHDLSPRDDVDLGVCGSNLEAADVCLVCHVLKARDVQSCCTVREDFDVCNERFLELAGPKAESGLLDDVIPAESQELNGLEAEKRNPGGHFRSFNRAWYKGKRASANKIFSKFNRMWYKSRG